MSEHVPDYPPDWPDNVTPINAYRQVERVNGIALKFHLLSYSDLVALETSCAARADEARFEAAIVRDYRESWYPQGGPPDGPDAA